MLVEKGTGEGGIYINPICIFTKMVHSNVQLSYTHSIPANIPKHTIRNNNDK